MCGDGEFDVVLESAEPPPPIINDDPRLAVIAARFRPTPLVAQAQAARPVPAIEGGQEADRTLGDSFDQKVPAE